VSTRAARFLRRGFVDSPAGEWLAICTLHGPEARSLHGLSAVAAARGSDADAHLFAA
jgi:hypothetical protein